MSRSYNDDNLSSGVDVVTLDNRKSIYIVIVTEMSRTVEIMSFSYILEKQLLLDIEWQEQIKYELQ